MKYFWLVSATFLIIHLSGVENANILAIFPLVQKSHYVMFKVLLEELARRGHEIDVLGGIPPTESVPGITYIENPNIPDLQIPDFTLRDLRKFTVNFALKFMFSTSTEICRESFKTEVMKNLRDSKKKYDLLIIEIFICDCFFGFAHTLKVPVVSLISSTDLPWGSHRIGNPDNPAYIPVYFQGFRPHKSMYEKIWNLVTYIHTKVGHWWYIQEQNEVSKNFFGADMPHLNDIISNISLLLMNSHFSLNLARPAVPNFVEVGGLHIKTPKTLDKEMIDFIGNDKFIYFSLGSIANSETFESEQLKSIVDTFSEMDYKVIWKANKTIVADSVKIPSNLLIRSWIPQLDTLCHPNVVLFISHTGLLGTQEAIHCGVPILCMPLFADQYQNCQNLVDRQIAIALEADSFTKEEFSNAVSELIEDPKYKDNAKSLSKQFKDRPMSPLETAVYWVEYVLRYKGASQLRSESASLAWYQYYSVDIFCIVTLVLVVSLISSYAVLRFILIRVKRKLMLNNKSEIKKKI